jgi:ribosomal protein S18 acetylase RimI-like enzyme
VIEYRQATLRDAKAIASLHAQSWRAHYRGEFTDAFLDGDLPRERLGVWRARLGDPAKSQLVLVAVDGDDLAGFLCAYGRHDVRWGSFIDNIHVARTSKRSGIGASLMEQAGAWLDLHYTGLGVYLWVLEVNSAARRFYERLGAHNAGTSTMETHGGAIVRSCRYIWSDARLLSDA